jgi:hypothetical protein
MEMQKIINNLKNPHRDFKQRFSYQEELNAIAEIVRSNGIVEEAIHIEPFILSEANNIRQKLKVYKRYI